MQNHKTTVNSNNPDITNKEMSLEELDVLCRKYNHLHDEELLKIISRFYTKISLFFRETKQPSNVPTKL
ncbi:MAG: hypothetical protein COA36_15580 [Desulfotalea sp.]|nr:MAG: hypothetical protein COA36_15580 [Desulfotalea sp.]